VPSIAAIALTPKKKSVTSSERNPDKRAWHWRRSAGCEVERLKFIDEAAVHTAMTRRYGRAAPGDRVSESLPRNYGSSTSVISCLGWHGVAATMTVDGAVDTLVFDTYVEQILRPSLQPGDILVLDNLSAHKASCLEAVSAACGVRVLWLPPYSPDYSPIEQLWSKVKEALRALKARTREALEEALTYALQLVSTTDIRGWFSHCGYEVAPN
jgi:transposase